jgi:hypothetical protein
MNTLEAAIGHQGHDIPGSMFAHDCLDDLIGIRDVSRPLTAGPQIVNQLGGIQSLCIRQCGAVHGCDDNLVGRTEGLKSSEHATA